MSKSLSEEAGSLVFSAVEREPTLATQVTEQIEQLIIERHLEPGDRLPSERELARQFGVSRTVVREAVRALSARGLLRVTSGSGTVVGTPSPETVSKSVMMLLRTGGPEFDYDKVNEVRRLLEIEIAGLAAARRTADDLERLRALVEEMARVQGDRDRFTRNDVAFHVALASATHNELFVVLLDSLSDVMLKVRLTGYRSPDAPHHAVEYHRRIYERVRDQQVDAARQVMSEHLDISERIFREGLARQQDANGVSSANR